MITLKCKDAAETEKLGRKIGELAYPGLVIAFKGGLGAGKTTMCKGIALGLGIEDPITSPTYTIINEYEGRLPFFHFDAYRLSGVDEFEMLDPVNYLYGEGLCAIEWSENVSPSMPKDALCIEIIPLENGERKIILSGNSITEKLK